MISRIFLTVGLLSTAMLFAQPAAAAGDVAKGKKAFNKCKACHTVKAGKHKIGPSLAGIVGAKAGSVAGFKKYNGLKGADWVWDEANLDAYLANPKKFTKAKSGKKAAMTLKTKKAATRANLIAYIKSIK